MTTRIAHPSRGWPRCGLGLLLLVTANAFAVNELGWSLGGTSEHSSNPGRVPEATDSGVVHGVDAGLNLRHDSRSVDAAVDVGANRTWYPDSVFDDESVVSAYGELDLHLSPDQLTWVTRNRYAQIREAELAAITPDNRQNVNAFVTGPDLRIPLTRVDFARLSLRHGRYDFSETESDNIRHAATVGVERRISPRTRVSLNAGIEQVDFAVDDEPQVDFDRTSLFVRTERAMPRGSLELDLGYNEVRREGLDDVAGPLVNLRAERRLGAASTAGLVLAAATTDPVSGLASSPDDPLAARIDRVTVTGEVGQIRRAQAFAETRAGATRWSVAAGTSREDFDDPAREIDRHDARLGLDWRLTSRLSAYAAAGGVESRFAPEDTRERIMTTGLGLERLLGRGLTARLGVSRYDQTFDDADNDVRDDRVMLALRYESRRRPTDGRNR